MGTAREDSRREYSSAQSDSDLRLGCLQRIADAVELTAKNYVAMQSDRDHCKRLFEAERMWRKRLERRVNALRGVITRLQRKLSQVDPSGLDAHEMGVANMEAG